MATTEDMLPLLRPVDVAELLNVSRKTAYRLIERGELSAVRIGTSVRVRPEDLAAYLERGGHR
jgi:excisionase family DNA binding protein